MEEVITRQKRKKNKTHRCIMHSAKALFETKDVGRVTVDEIAEKADISRSTFFNHFASIDDLLLELANQEIADLLDYVKKEKKSGLANIELLVNKLIEDIYAYPSLSMFLLTNNILNNKNQSCAQIVDIIKADLTSANTTVDNFDTEELTALILGAIFGLLNKKFIEDSPFNDMNQTKSTIRKVLHLLESKED